MSRSDSYSLGFENVIEEKAKVLKEEEITQKTCKNCALAKEERGKIVQLFGLKLYIFSKKLSKCVQFVKSNMKIFVTTLGKITRGSKIIGTEMKLSNQRRRFWAIFEDFVNAI